MKYTIKIIIFLLLIITQISCDNQRSDLSKFDVNEGVNYKETLKELAEELSSKNLLRIKKITTENGSSSLLSWSDSLYDISFINNLSKDLIYYNVADINEWNDSMVAISLGEKDKILGSTQGYIVLKKNNKGYKIDEYRGGK